MDWVHCWLPIEIRLLIFLNTNRKRLEGIVKPIIDAQLKNMFRSPEVKAIENEAFSRVENKMKSLTPEEEN